MCKVTIGCCQGNECKTHGLANNLKNGCVDLINHIAISSTQQEVLGLY